MGYCHHSQLNTDQRLFIIDPSHALAGSISPFHVPPSSAQIVSSHHLTQTLGFLRKQSSRPCDEWTNYCVNLLSFWHVTTFLSLKAGVGFCLQTKCDNSGITVLMASRWKVLISLREINFIPKMFEQETLDLAHALLPSLRAPLSLVYSHSTHVSSQEHERTENSYLQTTIKKK